MLSELQVAQFKRDGFLLLRNVFSESEVRFFIESAPTEKERATDLFAIPPLRSLWSDPRLIGVAKDLLGEPVTFFAEATYTHDLIQEEDPIRARYLHHDAKGTITNIFNRQHEPVNGFYPIIRFAIYLQDHATMSGGLKLVPGSHQMNSAAYDQADFDYLNVPSKPGDVVVFCNKILHAAFALRLKDDPEAALAPLAELEIYKDDRDAFLPTPRNRNVIFIDFAGDETLADIYIKGRAINPINPRVGCVATFEEGSMVADAARSGIRLRLDVAVVEALTAIYSGAQDGQISAKGAHYLALLPQLCRLSQSWSPYFDFVPKVGPDEKYSAVDLVRVLASRINELRQKNRELFTPDAHMVARVAE